MCAKVQTQTIRRIVGFIAVGALEMRMVQCVKSYRISIDRLIIVVIHNVMLGARLEGMQFKFMCAHIATPTKRFSANITVMILDSRMCNHMLGQIAGRVKSLLAE